MTPRPGTTPRKTLSVFGPRGDRVRVLVDEHRGRCEVHFRDASGLARKRVFPADKRGRKDAVAWAERYHEVRRREAEGHPRTPITVRDLWTLYVDSPAYDDLRAKSKTSYAERWRRWERFVGRDHDANLTRLVDVDRFVITARKAGLAVNQIRQVINVARIVYNWGTRRDLVHTNKLAVYTWRKPKDAAVMEPGEYSGAEFERLLKAFDYQTPASEHWRPWVALMLAGHAGQRANAVLHLRWRDVDWTRGVIVWPAEFQKQGVALERPITAPIRAALLVAEARRLALATRDVHEAIERFDARTAGLGDADWVLFAKNDKAQPYSYSSLHYQVRQAEIRAKVAHEPYRLVHGFRRMVVGEVIERTGDRLLGLEVVGDNDPKQLKSYDRRKQQRIDTAAAMVGSHTKGGEP